MVKFTAAVLAAAITCAVIFLVALAIMRIEELLT